MALVLKDRVKEASSSSGTGSITLGGAIPGYQSFNTAIPTASVVYYCIHNLAVGFDTEWEVGYGTFTAPATLSRTSVLSSSNASALVNFTAGANGLEVFITQPAEQAVFQQTNGDVLIPSGILTVLGANATNPTFTGTLGEFVSNEANFSQLLTQNQNSSANASTDVVSYNNLGDGTNYFVDTGIVSSTYNDGAYPIFQANDAYLYNAGNIAGTGAAGDISRLMIGTSTANSNVVVFGGSVETNAVIATFVASTKNVNFANSISVTANASANNITVTNFAYSGANLSNAANSTVLTTKAYVDSAVATGFVVHVAVRAASTAAFAGTIYNNGTAGVGATLTADTNRQFDTLDGVSVTVGQRVLIKDMTTAAYNGAYTLTSNGSTGVSPWVLTRATDFDTVGAGEVANNAYFFVQAGTVNAGSAWVLNQLAAITIGTTSLPFDLFASALVYVGGQNINISGQTISLTGVVPVANGGTNLSTFTSGDLIYANAANTLASRAIGASNTVLVSNGSVPDWGTVALGSGNAVSGTLGATNGGTAQSSYTLGDTLYSSATNTLARLTGNITTTKKYLQQLGDGVNSAAPSWVQVAAADISGLGTMSTQNANAVAITGGSLNNVVIGGSTANAGTFTNVNATTVTATTGSFTNVSGNGVALTAINASNISSGTIDNARTSANTSNSASTIVLRDATGNFGANTISAAFSGDGSALTSINASNISSGTVANARTTAATANGASTIVLRDGSGGFGAGAITAVSISGNGVALTAINASNIASGTIDNARTSAATANGASTIVLRGSSGEFSAGAITGTSFSGNGSALTAINASAITTGTIANARTTASDANGASTIVSRDASGNFTANAGTFTSISGNGVALTAINASNISSGTIANARTTAATANGASTIVLRGTSGEFSAGVITADGSALTAINASSISTGTIANARTTAASANGASTIVARDASGNFTAGTITASLTGNASGSAATFTSTSQNSQFNSIGVGTAGSTTAGEIRATNNVTAYYSSDERLKDNVKVISNALAKVLQIRGVEFDWNNLKDPEDGYFVRKHDVGVIAQEIEKVLPEVVAIREDGIKAVKYDRIIPLLIEAIKELEAQVAELKAK
jgi:hypothetical protein